MFYHGRSDDMFKVSGATVYPSEVEQALRTIDGVDNAFVTEVSGGPIGSAPRWSVIRVIRRPSARAARKTAELVQGPTVWLWSTPTTTSPAAPPARSTSVG